VYAQGLPKGASWDVGFLTLKEGMEPGNNGVIWSVKGRKMLFESKRDGKREVYAMDANGGDLRNLSNNPDGNDTHPRWNPQLEPRSGEPRQKRFTTLGAIKRSALAKD